MESCHRFLPYMSYCFNPRCQKPQNPDDNKFCQSCGSKLLLREHYRAIKPIGTGTFSRTFLAVDEDIPSKPTCIIKQFFPPTSGAAKAAELFGREALQLDRLGKHPQIPRLLAYFEQNLRQYLVQEFIEGQNLANELAESGAFSENKIRQLLLDLLPVLQFVHSHQVIHRDIKPANMIRRSPESRGGWGAELVLVGFGASKAISRMAAVSTGTVIGSPEYTAPEQLGGQAGFASDLYSLGVTCIELLTATAPFNLRHGNEWVWQQHLPRPVSASVVGILDKMLHWSVEQRYQSAEEVLKDLSAMQPASWKCVETLVGGDRVRCVAINPDGQIIAGGGEDNSIKLWYPGSGKRPDSLGSLFFSHAGWVNAIAFSPDGQVLVSGSGDQTIKVWQLATGKLVRTIGGWLGGHSGAVNAIAISQNGKFLASGSADQTIKLWQLRDGKQLGTLAGHSAWVEAIAISSDSKILASGSGDLSIKIWQMKSGKEVATLTGHSDVVRALAISARSPILASGSSDNTVKLWQLTDGGHPQDMSLHTLTHSDWINAVAFSPTGELLAAGSRNGSISLWNPYTGDRLTTLTAHSAAVTSVAFSPNGQLLISGSADGTVKIWLSNG